ncbi:MAG: NADH:flavin oxidoreductase/NADH oxidase [Rhodospirillaceae bacterium]
MASKLFTPIQLRSVELPNRIIVAPMCQYSAHDGDPTDWHLMHLGQFAVAGTGLVFVEASGVEAIGRITPGCTGIWSDAQEEKFKHIVEFCRGYGNARIGMQLAHAGRKASCLVPWQGGTQMAADDPNGWPVVGPSAEAYADGWQTPQALDDAGLARIKDAFVKATERCVRIGFDVIEIHMAHGYLLQQFLSPISNKRNDGYGGSLDGRMRFPLECFEAVRAAWPDELPLGVRISSVDWVEGGWTIEDSIAFAAELKKRGCDFIDCSSGGNSPLQEIDAGPGYQTGFAAEVRRGADIPTMAVGQITQARQAEAIIRSGQADMVALARGMLYDPHWAWHAADELNAQAAFPPQYARSHPSMQGLPIPGNPPAPKN